MISNLTLASVASTVYQAQAAQAARESLRAQRMHSAALPEQESLQESLDARRLKQQLESEKLLRAQSASPRSLVEITGQSLALSSVAFLQTFGGSPQAFAEENGETPQDTGSRQRGYAAYQQYSEILDALGQIADDTGAFSTASATDFAALLPRQLLLNETLPTQDQPFIASEVSDFTATQADTLDDAAPPYFQLSYAAFSRAMDFRNQAFAFPPQLNLIG